MSLSVVTMAFIATLGTWLLTALGAATVVFFKTHGNRHLNAMMGFAAGVMIAASFWSLLAPAIELASKGGSPGWLIATAGFLSGAFFIYGIDKLLGKTLKRSCKEDGVAGNRNLRRIFMLITSITLHNIPEGLAVGVAFGALHGPLYTNEGLMAAISIAVGIGIQNFPEGAAVSLPLRREGYSRTKSFMLGQLSGAVEPISAVLGAVLVMHVNAILPFALSFAAGTMILVAVHELIPEAQKNQTGSPYFATMGVILGFAVMMMLDVMLG